MWPQLQACHSGVIGGICQRAANAGACPASGAWGIACIMKRAPRSMQHLKTITLSVLAAQAFDLEPWPAGSPDLACYHTFPTMVRQHHDLAALGCLQPNPASLWQADLHEACMARFLDLATGADAPVQKPPNLTRGVLGRWCKLL